MQKAFFWKNPNRVKIDYLNTILLSFYFKPNNYFSYQLELHSVNGLNKIGELKMYSYFNKVGKMFFVAR